MGAMEFLRESELARIDAAAHAGLRVRSGDVWLTQQDDPNDYYVRAGEELQFTGKPGPVRVTAYKPSILELHEADPIGMRQAIERRARAARSAGVYAACACLLSAAGRLLRREAKAALSRMRRSRSSPAFRCKLGVSRERFAPWSNNTSV